LLFSFVVFVLVDFFGWESIEKVLFILKNEAILVSNHCFVRIELKED